MASRMFFTILAATAAASYASAQSVTTLTMPVPRGVPTAAALAGKPLELPGSMQFEPIETHSGTSTFIIHHAHAAFTTSGASTVASTASTSGSAAVATDTPVKIAGVPLPTVKQTLILSPTEAIMKVGALGVDSTHSCKWAAGPSPTATCVGGIVGIPTGVTMTVPVQAIQATLAAHTSGASAPAVASWALVGAVTLGAFMAL